MTLKDIPRIGTYLKWPPLARRFLFQYSLTNSTRIKWVSERSNEIRRFIEFSNMYRRCAHESWAMKYWTKTGKWFLRCIRTQSWEETTFGVGIYFWSPHSDFPGNCVSDWKVSKMILGLRQLSFHKRRFSWETKTVSLNEYQIKRQSTKNATESTVSLGEKYWLLRSGSRSYRCLENSEIGGVVLAV